MKENIEFIRFGFSYSILNIKDYIKGLYPYGTLAFENTYKSNSCRITLKI